MRILVFIVLLISSINVFAQADLGSPGETHLKNITQLTFGGENAEAYFSFDGKRLSFQSKRDGNKCDRIYSMKIDGSDVKQISNGEGRTTCSFYFKNGKKMLYASTQLGSKDCPPDPDFSKGYVWAVYPSYDIFTADADGKNIKQLTKTPGYDAEGTVSPNGKKIVFTSERDGDLELYSMDTNGKNVKRLTFEPGYDGGAFYSPDNKMIVYRGSHPTDPKLAERDKELLKNHLIVPTVFEVWVMKADGSGKRQVTKLNAASFAPFFTPDGKADSLLYQLFCDRSSQTKFRYRNDKC